MLVSENTFPCRIYYSTNQNGQRYKVEEYEEVKNELVERKKWHPLNKIEGFAYPLGWKNLSLDYLPVRVLGYLPVAGFITGVMDVAYSVHMIYKFVISNQGTTRQERDEVIEDVTEPKIKRTISIYQIDFSNKQRVALLGLSVALFARGVITFCQVGVIFVPLDLFADRFLKA
jgi:hypothetical protein